MFLYSIVNSILPKNPSALVRCYIISLHHKLNLKTFFDIFFPMNNKMVGFENLACIHTSNTISWFSCQKIVSAIEKNIVKFIESIFSIRL